MNHANKTSPDSQDDRRTSPCKTKLHSAGAGDNDVQSNPSQTTKQTPPSPSRSSSSSSSSTPTHAQRRAAADAVAVDVPASDHDDDLPQTTTDFNGSGSSNSRRPPPPPRDCGLAADFLLRQQQQQQEQQHQQHTKRSAGRSSSSKQHGVTPIDPEEVEAALRQQLDLLYSATDAWLRSIHQMSAAMLRVSAIRDMAADGARDCSTTAAQRRISEQLKAKSTNNNGSSGGGSYATLAAGFLSNISRCAIADHVSQRKHINKFLRRGMRIEEILALIDEANRAEVMPLQHDGEQAKNQHQSSASAADGGSSSPSRPVFYSPNTAGASHSSMPPSSSFSHSQNNNNKSSRQHQQQRKEHSLAIQRSMFAHLVESSDRALASVLGTLRDVSSDTVKNALRGQIFDSSEQEQEAAEHTLRTVLAVHTEGAAAAAARMRPAPPSRHDQQQQRDPVDVAATNNASGSDDPQGFYGSGVAAPVVPPLLQNAHLPLQNHNTNDFNHNNPKGHHEHGADDVFLPPPVKAAATTTAAHNNSCDNYYYNSNSHTVVRSLDFSCNKPADKPNVLNQQQHYYNNGNTSAGGSTASSKMLNHSASGMAPPPASAGAATRFPSIAAVPQTEEATDRILAMVSAACANRADNFRFADPAPVAAAFG